MNYIHTHFNDRTKAGNDEGYTSKYFKLFNEGMPCFNGSEEENIDAINYWITFMDEFEHKSSEPPNSIPAGYTYFGQFIAHDLTFDSGAFFNRRDNTKSVYNINTPTIDLDSIYRKNNEKVIKELSKSNIDTNKKDRRNGEHLIISQLRLAFDKFHKKIETELKLNKSKGEEEEIYNKAKKITIWNYQWLVINDFLRWFVDENIIRKILKEGPKFYKIHVKDLQIPFEFSVAAFRFGHSMVREQYVFTDESKVTGITFKELLAFPPKSLDWKRFFFKVPVEKDTESSLNFANYIAPRLTKPLEKFPKNNKFLLKQKLGGKNLAKLNLETSQNYELRSGQFIHKQMFPRQKTLTVGNNDKYKNNTPLWIYILYEASKKKKGKKLGSVGGTLVAEVIIELISLDTTSYLVEGKGEKWQPKVKTFQEFLDFAEVY